MCPPRTERVACALVAAAALGALLAGCSDLYFARRDTVVLGGGDAVAANEAAQTINPWPAQSGNANIAANGQRMQSAVERYRTHKVIQPVDPTTSDVENHQAQQSPTPATGTQSASASSTPPATAGQ
jgi:hypothetical protein